ncbi:MAG: sulfite exporter TauE/SafE family protein [Planctomycetes bacterium]|nr:sulfite exporter TauE/SafE family protein [Planctomycetota bacterium]
MHEAIPPETLAFLALFVFLGFTTQAMAGFGGTVITLTLGALLLPIERLVPLIVAVGWVQTFVLSVRLRGDVEWRLLGTFVMPLMVVGAVGGLVLQEYVGGVTLKVVYGVFVVTVAARELRLMARANGDAQEPLPRPAAVLCTLGAGLIHGIYASGGPLLVYVIGRLGLAKGAFRATLITVWLPVNTGLLIWYVVSGRLTSQDLPAAGLLLIPIGLALVVGEWGHQKVDERRFKTIANGLLLVAGCVLLFATVRDLQNAPPPPGSPTPTPGGIAAPSTGAR